MDLPAASRRGFIIRGVQASLLAPGLLAQACSTPDRSIADGSSAVRDARAPERSEAGDPQTCLVTRPDIEGPYFKPSSPERKNLVDGLSGVRLALVGKIVDASCRPIEGAIIDFWQADDDGAYDNAGFTLRGHQIVGEDGRYALSTIVPGRYLNGSQYRPAHLHCKIYIDGRAVLTTQLYFEDDPYNGIDPWFSVLTMLRPVKVVGDSNDLTAAFDFSVV
jgi:protocatechuate 3,4-dioxygenase beta subunit